MQVTASRKVDVLIKDDKSSYTGCSRIYDPISKFYKKQAKIQRKLKYFLKGYEMPFQFSSLLQVVLKIVSLKWRPPMSMQF